MNTTPITKDPAAFARFKGSAERGYFRDAFNLLLGSDRYTIDEQTIRALNVPNLLEEARLLASSYEPQLGRKILMAAPTEAALPSIVDHQRARYQLSHFDMLEDFSRCLQILERFGVRAPHDVITPEFAEWARSKSTEHGFAERIARHFTPEVYSP